MKKSSSKFILHSLIDKILLLTILMGILIFVLYPIISVVSTSFFDKGQLTLKFYKDLISQRNFQLIKNSLWVASLSSVFTTILSFCIALYAFVAKKQLRNFIRSTLMLTMISPPFVSALALIMLFGRRGLITYGIFNLSVNPYGWQGIVILQTIGSMSLASIMLISTLDTIDTRQILASRDLGATPLQTLRNIVIPAAWPGIMSVLFILFTMNLADFGTPIVIGGRFSVLATEAYIQVLSASSLGKAATLSMLMIPPAVIAFYFYRKNMSSSNNFSDGSKSLSSSGYKYDLPKWIRGILLCVVISFFAVMALKYGNIFLSTISNTSTGEIQFTTKNITNIPSSQMKSFWQTVIYSIIAGVLASFFGVLLSYYTHRREIKGMKIIEFIASLPYIIPGTFFGLGYVAAFSHGPILIRGTSAIIVLNYTFRQISVANKSANATFSTIDKKIEAASQDLGASKVQTLFRIILPLLKPTFLTCFITTFTASMTAVGAIVFLTSPGKNVASVELLQSIENGRYGIASVQAVMIIIVTVTVNIIAMYILERSKKDNESMEIISDIER
ncbi:MAG: iron ABC transporter permease [Clostridium sp.]